MASPRETAYQEYQKQYDELLKFAKKAKENGTKEQIDSDDSAFSFRRTALLETYNKYAEAAMEEIQKTQESSSSEDDKKKKIDQIIRENSRLWQTHEPLVKFKSNHHAYEFKNYVEACQYGKQLFRPQGETGPIPEEFEFTLNEQNQQNEKYKCRFITSTNQPEINQVRFMSSVATLLNMPSHLVPETRKGVVCPYNNNTQKTVGTLMLMPKGVGECCEFHEIPGGETEDNQADLMKDTMDIHVLLYVTGADLKNSKRIRFAKKVPVGLGKGAPKTRLGLMLDPSGLTFDPNNRVKLEDLRIMNWTTGAHLSSKEDTLMQLENQDRVSPAALGLMAMTFGRGYSEAMALMDRMTNLRNTLDETLKKKGKYLVKNASDPQWKEQLEQEKSLFLIDDEQLDTGNAENFYGKIQKNLRGCYKAVKNGTVLPEKNLCNTFLKKMGPKPKGLGTAVKNFRNAQKWLNGAKVSAIPYIDWLLSSHEYNAMKTKLAELVPILEQCDTAEKQGDQESLKQAGEQLEKLVGELQTNAGNYLKRKKGKKKIEECTGLERSRIFAVTELNFQLGRLKTWLEKDFPKLPASAGTGQEEPEEPKRPTLRIMSYNERYNIKPFMLGMFHHSNFMGGIVPEVLNDGSNSHPYSGHLFY